MVGTVQGFHPLSSDVGINLCGTEITVPQQQLHHPQISAVIDQMRGKGMPTLRRGVVGDQIVEVQVETPTNLSKKQRELLQVFSESGNSSPESDSFIERVKRIWADS